VQCEFLEDEVINEVIEVRTELDFLNMTTVKIKPKPTQKQFGEVHVIVSCYYNMTYLSNITVTNYLGLDISVEVRGFWEPSFRQGKIGKEGQAISVNPGEWYPIGVGANSLIEVNLPSIEIASSNVSTQIAQGTTDDGQAMLEFKVSKPTLSKQLLTAYLPLFTGSPIKDNLDPLNLDNDDKRFYKVHSVYVFGDLLLLLGDSFENYGEYKPFSYFKVYDIEDLYSEAKLANEAKKHNASRVADYVFSQHPIAGFIVPDTNASYIQIIGSSKNSANDKTLANTHEIGSTTTKAPMTLLLKYCNEETNTTHFTKIHQSKGFSLDSTPTKLEGIYPDCKIFVVGSIDIISCISKDSKTLAHMVVNRDPFLIRKFDRNSGQVAFVVEVSEIVKNLKYNTNMAADKIWPKLRQLKCLIRSIDFYSATDYEMFIVGLYCPDEGITIVGWMGKYFLHSGFSKEFYASLDFFLITRQVYDISFIYNEYFFMYRNNIGLSTAYEGEDEEYRYYDEPEVGMLYWKHKCFQGYDLCVMFKNQTVEGKKVSTVVSVHKISDKREPWTRMHFNQSYPDDIVDVDCSVFNETLVRVVFLLKEYGQDNVHMVDCLRTSVLDINLLHASFNYRLEVPENQVMERPLTYNVKFNQHYSLEYTFADVSSNMNSLQVKPTALAKKSVSNVIPGQKIDLLSLFSIKGPLYSLSLSKNTHENITLTSFIKLSRTDERLNINCFNILKIDLHKFVCLEETGSLTLFENNTGTYLFNILKDHPYIKAETHMIYLSSIQVIEYNSKLYFIIMYTSELKQIARANSFMPLLLFVEVTVSKEKSAVAIEFFSPIFACRCTVRKDHHQPIFVKVSENKQWVYIVPVYFEMIVVLAIPLREYESLGDAMKNFFENIGSKRQIQVEYVSRKVDVAMVGDKLLILIDNYGDRLWAELIGTRNSTSYEVDILISSSLGDSQPNAQIKFIEDRPDANVYEFCSVYRDRATRRVQMPVSFKRYVEFINNNKFLMHTLCIYYYKLFDKFYLLLANPETNKNAIVAFRMPSDDPISSTCATKDYFIVKKTSLDSGQNPVVYIFNLPFNVSTADTNYPVQTFTLPLGDNHFIGCLYSPVDSFYLYNSHDRFMHTYTLTQPAINFPDKDLIDEGDHIVEVHFLDHRGRRTTKSIKFNLPQSTDSKDIKRFEISQVKDFIIENYLRILIALLFLAIIVIGGYLLFCTHHSQMFNLNYPQNVI